MFERGSQLSSSLKTNPGEHTQSNLKSKAAWFLEQSNSANNSLSTTASSSQNSQSSGAFASRIKDLEAKLNAASGLSCFETNAESYTNSHVQDRQKKLVNAKLGLHVLTTATTLEQLLNPKQQEDKLKKAAANYRKKHHDIKNHCITKMTNETDWNKARWDQIEKEAKGECSA